MESKAEATYKIVLDRYPSKAAEELCQVPGEHQDAVVRDRSALLAERWLHKVLIRLVGRWCV